jgi:hypothetical protein
VARVLGLAAVAAPFGRGAVADFVRDGVLAMGRKDSSGLLSRTPLAEAPPPPPHAHPMVAGRSGR